jgi:hypothetical protein
MVSPPEASLSSLPYSWAIIMAQVAHQIPGACRCDNPMGPLYPNEYTLVTRALLMVHIRTTCLDEVSMGLLKDTSAEVQGQCRTTRQDLPWGPSPDCKIQRVLEPLDDLQRLNLSQLPNLFIPATQKSAIRLGWIHFPVAIMGIRAKYSPEGLWSIILLLETP